MQMCMYGSASKFKSVCNYKSGYCYLALNLNLNFDLDLGVA